MGRDELDVSPDTALRSINHELNRGSIALSLEEINIAILQVYSLQIDYPPTYILSFELLEMGNIWNDLADKACFPRLKRVGIHLDFMRCNPSVIHEGNFQYVIAQKLPLLAKTGLLHATLRENIDWHDFL